MTSARAFSASESPELNISNTEKFGGERASDLGARVATPVQWPRYSGGDGRLVCSCIECELI